MPCLLVMARVTLQKNTAVGSAQRFIEKSSPDFSLIERENHNPDPY